ncbi:MAG: hypothetical protein ACI8XD_001275 [Thermoproteota archaeon]|jgi:hypothetical protein
MSSSRILSSIAAASLGIIMFGGCSAESLTKRAADFGLKPPVEPDQDIELDFDGCFSVSTDEGGFSLNSMKTTAASYSISTKAPEVINFDDGGGDTIETGEGNLGFFNPVDAPQTWPQIVGVPATLVPGSQSFSVCDLGDLVVTTGAVNHDHASPRVRVAQVLCGRPFRWPNTCEQMLICRGSASRDVQCSPGGGRHRSFWLHPLVAADVARHRPRPIFGCTDPAKV